jgi:hypothetical protein
MSPAHEIRRLIQHLFSGLDPKPARRSPAFVAGYLGFNIQTTQLRPYMAVAAIGIPRSGSQHSRHRLGSMRVMCCATACHCPLRLTYVVVH